MIARVLDPMALRSFQLGSGLAVSASIRARSLSTLGRRVTSKVGTVSASRAAATNRLASSISLIEIVPSWLDRLLPCMI